MIDPLLLIVGPSKLQPFLYRSCNSLVMFATGFARSRCKMQLENWIGSKPNLVPSGEQLGEVDRFGYLVICISEKCLCVHIGLDWH